MESAKTLALLFSHTLTPRANGVVCEPCIRHRSLETTSPRSSLQHNSPQRAAMSRATPPRKPPLRYNSLPPTIVEDDDLCLPPPALPDDTKFAHWPLLDILDFATRHQDMCNLRAKSSGPLDEEVFTRHLLGIPESVRPTRFAKCTPKLQRKILRDIEMLIAEAQAYWAAAGTDC